MIVRDYPAPTNWLTTEIFDADNYEWSAHRTDTGAGVGEDNVIGQRQDEMEKNPCGQRATDKQS